VAQPPSWRIFLRRLTADPRRPAGRDNVDHLVEYPSLREYVWICMNKASCAISALVHLIVTSSG